MITTSDIVRSALEANQPTVALESTIFSDLGLPAPHNRDALERVFAAVAAEGATPALTAVIDGVITCGVGEELFDTICGPTRKASQRELGLAVANRWPYGATTVSASVTIAAQAGVPVFATGGIGGVHRNAAVTGDISADLGALARWPVITVTAGAKVFLDLSRTVEHLESLGVPVIGWHTDEFPAFHARSSGVPLTQTATDPEALARAAIAHWALGGGGIVVANPVPQEDAIESDQLDTWVQEALQLSGVSNRGGSDVTPAVLAALAEVSDGQTIMANLALAEHNASVAATIARALTDLA